MVLAVGMTLLTIAARYGEQCSGEQHMFPREMRIRARADRRCVLVSVCLFYGWNERTRFSDLLRCSGPLSDRVGVGVVIEPQPSTWQVHVSPTLTARTKAEKNHNSVVCQICLSVNCCNIWPGIIIIIVIVLHAVHPPFFSNFL